MSQQAHPGRRPTAGRRHRWEDTVLRALEYPANLALANLAWVLLALPVVTVLPALVAVATALDGWLRRDEQRPFRGTIEAFLPALRRLWGLSLASVSIGAALVLNLAFLSSRDEGVAALLVGLLIPFAVAYVGLHCALVPLAALRTDLSQIDLLRASAGLVLQHPVRTGFLIIVVAACGVFFVWPPLALLFGASVPVFLCLTAQLGRSPTDHHA